jgi:hypothetical protein
MTALFEQIAALDEQLLAVPFGSEFAAVPLLAQRGELIKALAAASFSPEQADSLLALQAATAVLQERYAHIRRRLAAEIGETGSHRQFLETLADSLERASSSGQILA